MATTTESSRSGRSRGRSGGGMTTETILDLVEKLGLIDLVTSKVRQRLEEVDLDELFDDIGEYIRRNPEVLVVALATITVSTGVMVYLNARHESDGGGRSTRSRASASHAESESGGAQRSRR